jgi:hypothetical protein
LSKSAETEHEVSTRVIQSRSESGDTETLTGGSSHKNVDCSIISSLYRREIAVERHFWEAVLKHRAGKFVDLGHELAFEAQRTPCHGSGFNA